MKTKMTMFLAAVFFCSSGWIYSNPASGADDQSGGIFAQPTESPLVEVTPGSIHDTEPAPTAAPASDAIAGGGQDLNTQAVKVSSFGAIDLHVKDLELSKVLQLLSIQSQRNIVASRNVAGSITADLYNVDFYQALDAILHTNGFGYREQGNFIYVYTQDEIKTIEDALRKPVTKVVRLNYLTATDASTFVSPLLSPAGSIAISGDPSQGFVASTSDGGANSFANASTMVIRDVPENVEEILAVLKDLDVRPQQVLIEATVLQADLAEDNNFGVDLNIVADFSISNFVDPFRIVDDLFGARPTRPAGEGGGIQTTPGQTNTGQSTFKLGIVSDKISAFIKALDQVTDTTVLANPKLLVLNRQRASMLVGRRLGYISTTQSDTSTTQSVEFLDVGTELGVRPFVGTDDMVRLELRPSISDGSTELKGDFVIPEQTTQEITTNVMVRSGQTVVLGGLFKESTKVARRQVPGVGDIPIIGVAFKGQDDTVTRNEVIFLVTPTIQKDAPMYAAGDEAKDQIDTAMIGSRQALLPWSRTKLVAANMQAALKYYEAGEHDKALWAVDLALRRDPTFVEAQRLKEQITGEKLWWPNRSILQGAVDKMVQEHLKLNAQAPAPQPQSAAPSEGQPADSAADADDAQPATDAAVMVTVE